MEKESELSESGKKMPYSVPDGFFEAITGKTLEEARRREKNRRKKITMWRSLSFAASIAALFTTGYFLLSPLSWKNSGQTARNSTESINQEIIVSDRQLMKDINSQTEIKTRENIEKVTINTSDEPEEIGDVLSSLSNDELLQLAALYKTDIFLDENENSIQ
jgi:hypothetical protein